MCTNNEHILVFIYEIISYFLMGLALDAGRFFSYFITMFFIIMTMNGFFRQIGAITRNFFVAGQLSNILYNLALMNAGYFLDFNSSHPWFKWYVFCDNRMIFVHIFVWLMIFSICRIYWINPIAYGYKAILINEMKGQKYSCDQPGQSVPYGPGYDDWAHRVCTAQGSAPGQSYVLGDDYLRDHLSYEPSQQWAPDFIVVSVKHSLLEIFF